MSQDIVLGMHVVVLCDAEMECQRTKGAECLEWHGTMYRMAAMIACLLTNPFKMQTCPPVSLHATAGISMKEK